MSAERIRLSWAQVAPTDSPGQPLWRGLLQLGARLPGGLVHADRITVVPSPPDFLEPLVEGSRWHALGNGLVVTALPAEGGVRAVLADLTAYRHIATQLQARFSDWPEAAQQLAKPQLPPQVALALAELLEATPAELAEVDRRAPGLRADLAVMLRRGFDPEISIHPALSDDRQREAGRTLAESLLSRIPAGRFHLLVSDAAAPLELLSPYAPDLGLSLYQWGLENTSQLPVPGLADRLRETQAAPERDLAAALASTLMSCEPHAVLAERRDNEAQQGLWLEDAWGATWGVADLGRLAAPDPAILRHETTDVLAVVVGGSAELRLAAAEHLARSGRLEGLAIYGSADMQGSLPIVPEALLWSDDAIRLELGTALVRFSSKLGIDTQRVGALQAGQQGAPQWVAGVLRAWRRARITGALDANAKPLLVLTPTPHAQNVPGLKVGFDAGRLVLAGLLEPELMSKQNTGKPRGSGRSSGVSRRFRA